MKRCYLIDVLRSKELAKKVKRICPKECYANVFRVFTSFPAEFRSGRLRVAYGYVSICDKLWTRHCFIITNNNEIIDPTLALQQDGLESRLYHVMKIFPSVQEYMEAIDSEHGYPALTRCLSREDVEAQQWCLDNGYYPVG